jgi:hypothetical protein
VDDSKDPTNPLKIQEESLLKEFNENKVVEKQEQNVLQKIHDEIKSIQAMIDANDKKMSKDFDYWYDIMVKKFEWESKNGKLDQFSTTATGTSNSRNNFNFYFFFQVVENKFALFFDTFEKQQGKYAFIYTYKERSQSRFNMFSTFMFI